MTQKKNRLALITGATAGIGEAIAFILGNHGYDLILTGRRTARLNSLKLNIERGGNCRVFPYSFDIRRREEVEKFARGLSGNLAEIDLLVNNAGLAAGFDNVYDGDPDDWDSMIDTNVKGLLLISRQIIPLMISRKKGHIVNVGSIAGKEVYDKGNVYCGTKHMVDALSRSMRRELAPYGIRVSAVHPGAVETEFSLVRFKGNAQKAKQVYRGFESLSAADIAEAVLFMVNRPQHVNINEMVVMPTAQPAAGVIHRS